ncbi:MAG: hypothetical protein P0Y50_08480 [Candidatus Brevundimonas colombiensis]|uniref:Uncharacterized protein n=1 Tax=Candidatus Brevundimonas colombiensis TaxID=3121376 RepID=A0AAJ5WW70_9CAUL|nr:hypothetical protein [Brevundimonas sp.]WEK38589.1 MAG: hypothetical protein P0Y50_08480 [Brevundimonas sp.]
MADPDNEDLNLTDEVQANLAIEQGLGVGARELAAQREAGEKAVDDEDHDGADLSDGRAQIKEV